VENNIDIIITKPSRMKQLKFVSDDKNNYEMLMQILFVCDHATKGNHHHAFTA